MYRKPNSSLMKRQIIKHLTSVHKIVTLSLAAVLVCSGCSSYSSNQGQQNSSKPIKSYGDRRSNDLRLSGPAVYQEPGSQQQRIRGPYGPHSTYKSSSLSQSTLPQQHKATSRSVHLNRKVSAALAQLDGIGLSYVIQMDGNAYVALALHGGGLGMKGNGGAPSREQQGVGYTYPGSTRVSPTPFAAPNVVDRSSSLRSVASSKDLSHEFKQTVAVKVREQLPHIKNVYISANADFFNQISAYATKVYPATSLSGYRTQIQQVIKDTMK
jgi:Sporulation lipoprotein YhcN/YlaJ (Spore_YhcN_YlaJ)